jgi:hypothetical protein
MINESKQKLNNINSSNNLNYEYLNTPKMLMNEISYSNNRNGNIFNSHF